MVIFDKKKKAIRDIAPDFLFKTRNISLKKAIEEYELDKVIEERRLDVYGRNDTK